LTAAGEPPSVKWSLPLTSFCASSSTATRKFESRCAQQSVRFQRRALSSVYVEPRSTLQNGLRSPGVVWLTEFPE
jgi:hypothetical protein